MRISDWSSDVCSSDLEVAFLRRRPRVAGGEREQRADQPQGFLDVDGYGLEQRAQLGKRDRRRVVGDEPGQPAQPLQQGIERAAAVERRAVKARSEEHTSELQSLMRNSYAVFCLKKHIIH